MMHKLKTFMMGSVFMLLTGCGSLDTASLPPTLSVATAQYAPLPATTDEPD